MIAVALSAAARLRLVCDSLSFGPTHRGDALAEIDEVRRLRKRRRGANDDATYCDRVFS